MGKRFVPSNLTIGYIRLPSSDKKRIYRYLRNSRKLGFITKKKKLKLPGDTKVLVYCVTETEVPLVAISAVMIRLSKDEGCSLKRWKAINRMLRKAEKKRAMKAAKELEEAAVK